MPRLGRVSFNINYVVDLDNQDMVDEAKQCVFEDVMNAVKYDEVAAHIEIELAPAASKEEIPEFLLPPKVDDDEENSITRRD